MDAEHRKELFSTRVRGESRTYFFDVKESSEGTRYLVISESRHNDEFDHHRVMVFDEHIDHFQQALIAAINELKAASTPDKSYSVAAIRKDHPMAYAKWTTEDDHRLWALHQSGKTTKELATLFKRKPGAIQSRLQKLALKVLPPNSTTSAVET